MTHMRTSLIALSIGLSAWIMLATPPSSAQECLDGSQIHTTVHRLELDFLINSMAMIAPDILMIYSYGIGFHFFAAHEDAQAELAGEWLCEDDPVAYDWDGSYLFCLFADGSVLVLDYRNPAAVSLAAEIQVPEAPEHLAADDGRLLLDRRLYDVRDPQDIRLISDAFMDPAPIGLDWNDGILVYTVEDKEYVWPCEGITAMVFDTSSQSMRLVEEFRFCPGTRILSLVVQNGMVGYQTSHARYSDDWGHYEGTDFFVTLWSLYGEAVFQSYDRTSDPYLPSPYGALVGMEQERMLFRNGGSLRWLDFSDGEAWRGYAGIAPYALGIYHGGVMRSRGEDGALYEYFSLAQTMDLVIDTQYWRAFYPRFVSEDLIYGYAGGYPVMYELTSDGLFQRRYSSVIGFGFTVRQLGDGWLLATDAGRIGVMELTEPYPTRHWLQDWDGGATAVSGDVCAFIHDGALVAYDAAAPASPRFLGSLALPEGDDQAELVGHPDRNGCFHVIEADRSGLRILSFVDALNGMTVVQQVEAEGSGGGVRILGNVLQLVGAMGGGYQSFGILPDGRLSEPVSLPFPWSEEAAIYHDGMLIVDTAANDPSGGERFVCFDVADPASPVLLHQLDVAIGEPRGVCGGYLVTASNAGGLVYPLPCGTTVANEPEPSHPGERLPAVMTLNPSVPNPFNPSTTISFRTPSPGTAHLAIHDGRGRKVRTLLAEAVPAGETSVVWDGRDDEGRSVTAGVYLVTLDLDGRVGAGKVTLLK